MSPRVVGLKAGNPAARQRNHRYRSETSVLLADTAAALQALARALEDDDGILGTLAGQHLANACAALPQNIRETLTDCLSDEAARGYRTDRLYWEQEQREASA